MMSVVDYDKSRMSTGTMITDIDDILYDSTDDTRERCSDAMFAERFQELVNTYAEEGKEDGGRQVS